MISTNQVAEALDRAGEDFAWCWEAVFGLEGRVGDLSVDDLYNFQPRLFEGLDKLSKMYRAVCTEEKRLISKKKTYDGQWFISRMRRMKGHKASILEALAIGKSIGDGFAWMFYRGDRHLIDKHLDEQRQKLIPGRIGGIGERILVDKVKRLDDHLILSHAITSFLRLGDVSLYDLKSGKVTAIGEVKTTYLGDSQYNVSLSMVSGDPDGIPRPKISASAKDKGPPPLEPRLAQKLKQQIRSISKAIRDAGVEGKDQHGSIIAKEIRFHHSHLAKVIRSAEKKGVATVKADRGLMLIAIKPPRKEGLSGRITGKAESIIKKLDGILHEAISITSRTLPDNSVLIGGIGAGDGELSLGREALPLVWWPLRKELIRKLLFREIMIVTLFNPAFMWRDLRERGFKVELKERAKVTAVRGDGDDAIGIENFDYYYGLVTHSLMSEQAVMGMVDQFLEISEQKRREGYQRVQMVPRIILPPRSDEPA